MNSQIEEQAEQKTLGKKLGEIAGVALVNMTKDHRWYTNWRTRDEYDQWTKEDFRQLEWKGDGANVGAFGTAAIDFVIEVKPKLEAIIQEEVAKQKEKWEKAYGGCHNCYGKGYATVKSQMLGYGTDGDIGGFEGKYKQDTPVQMKFCNCDRGRQLESHIAHLSQKEEGVKE